MIDRFLRYSLSRARPVRAAVLQDGAVKYINITVVDMEGGTVRYLSSKNRKTPRELDRDSLLSVGYARGDHGDTLENEEKEQEK